MKAKTGIRTAVLAAWDAAAWLGRYKGPDRKMTFLGHLLRYAFVHPSRKGRTTMDIPGMVSKWLEAIVGMSRAHSKDEYDAHDARTDELMGPLLAAPVAQLRTFYAQLLEKLQNDERVPMLVWIGFQAWGEVMVKDAPDEGVKRLKNQLAREIAHLVEQDIRDQIPQAIQRALRWRDPETLQQVKETLQAGAKPKLRGRESCLFLEAGRGKKKVCVML